MTWDRYISCNLVCPPSSPHLQWIIKLPKSQTSKLQLPMLLPFFLSFFVNMAIFGLLQEVLRHVQLESKWIRTLAKQRWICCRLGILKLSRLRIIFSNGTLKLCKYMWFYMNVNGICSLFLGGDFVSWNFHRPRDMFESRIIAQLVLKFYHPHGLSPNFPISICPKTMAFLLGGGRWEVL